MQWLSEAFDALEVITTLFLFCFLLTFSFVSNKKKKIAFDKRYVSGPLS